MNNNRNLSSFLGLLLLLFPISVAHTAELTTHRDRATSWCATWDWGIEVALAKHELNRRRLDRGFTVQNGSTEPFEVSTLQIEKNGDVAVIRDDGTLILSRNPFDYENRGAKFIRKGMNGYKVRNLGGSVKTELGDKLALGDDDATRIDLDEFQIRYYGKNYSSLFVNSDGNLTFGESDTASTSRDIQRLLNGPPRVAPFFADLDPSAATGDGGVYVRFVGSKIMVTWWNVPEFGTTNANTFQVTMNPRGNAEVRFGDMAALEGIVGVAPGGGGGLELFDLTSELPIKRKGVAMAERFSEDESLDEASVAAAFYQGFADVYDQLVMFTDFGRRAGDGAIAYHLTVKNDIRGIGRAVYDGTRFFSSTGRLAGFINMGGQSQYDSKVSKPVFWDVYSATDILAHEIGHSWLVSATFSDSSGNESGALLGRGNAHWNFFFDSDLSFMEGNQIRDDGGGLFTTVMKRATYNPFDRYLMGLIPANEVPDKFYVQATDGPDASTVPVQPGESLHGNAIYVSIDQIIDSLGPRNPTVDNSQKDFRIGIILLTKDGQQPSGSTITKVQKIANAIEKLFKKETGNRATLDTTLVAR